VEDDDLCWRKCVSVSRNTNVSSKNERESRRNRSVVKGIIWYGSGEHVWYLLLRHVVCSKLLQISTWIVENSNVWIERCIVTDGTYGSESEGLLTIVNTIDQSLKYNLGW